MGKIKETGRPKLAHLPQIMEDMKCVISKKKKIYFKTKILIYRLKRQREKERHWRNVVLQKKLKGRIE